MNDFTFEMEKRFGNRFKRNVILSQYTTFKIGGPADYFIEALNADDLVSAVKLSRQYGIPVYVVGGGSNILVSDSGFRGMVIKNNAGKFGICAMKGMAGKSGSEKYAFVNSESGTVFNRLVRYTIDQGLAGLEMHLGLPGSVGGAVAMNSKWMHPSGSVGDAVYQATILTQKGEIRIVPQSYFHFSYGKSIIRECGDILIEVIFKLVESDRDKLWQIANDSIAYRRQTQPQGQFCAGCIFRNISETEALEMNIPNQITSAGFLIDRSGVKGETVNGAQISETHANFIVNSGNASAADVIKLINRAHEQVKKQFKVNLEEEVIRVGDF